MIFTLPGSELKLSTYGRVAAVMSAVSVGTHVLIGARWMYCSLKGFFGLRKLRQLYDRPSEMMLRKVKDKLNAQCQEFIEKSTFMVLGTAGAVVDVSPRGGPPGFVTVRDDRTLWIPDRRGNNRLDSLQNLATDGRVQLLFLVPGMRETLRVGGVARLIYDPAILNKYIECEIPPKCVVEINVTSVYLQCGKAIIRSGLWNPEKILPQDQLPSSACMLAEQTGMMSANEIQKIMDEGYVKRLN